MDDWTKDVGDGDARKDEDERFEDVVNEDMQKVGVKVEETGNDMVW